MNFTENVVLFICIIVNCICLLRFTNVGAYQINFDIAVRHLLSISVLVPCRLRLTIIEVIQKTYVRDEVSTGR